MNEDLAGVEFFDVAVEMALNAADGFVGGVDLAVDADGDEGDDEGGEDGDGGEGEGDGRHEEDGGGDFEDLFDGFVEGDGHEFANDAGVFGHDGDDFAGFFLVVELHGEVVDFGEDLGAEMGGVFGGDLGENDTDEEAGESEEGVKRDEEGDGGEEIGDLKMVAGAEVSDGEVDDLPENFGGERGSENAGEGKDNDEGEGGEMRAEGGE